MIDPQFFFSWWELAGGGKACKMTPGNMDSWRMYCMGGEL